MGPREFMTLDGTLYLDESGQAWMVYAHEWVQLLDGTIEAIQLDAGLVRSVGNPIHLFRGSEAKLLREDARRARCHRCRTSRTVPSCGGWQVEDC